MKRTIKTYYADQTKAAGVAFNLKRTGAFRHMSSSVGPRIHPASTLLKLTPVNNCCGLRRSCIYRSFCNSFQHSATLHNVAYTTTLGLVEVELLYLSSPPSLKTNTRFFTLVGIRFQTHTHTHCISHMHKYT